MDSFTDIDDNKENYYDCFDVADTVGTITDCLTPSTSKELFNGGFTFEASRMNTPHVSKGRRFYRGHSRMNTPHVSKGHRFYRGHVSHVRGSLATPSASRKRGSLATPSSSRKILSPISALVISKNNNKSSLCSSNRKQTISQAKGQIKSQSKAIKQANTNLRAGLETSSREEYSEEKDLSSNTVFNQRPNGSSCSVKYNWKRMHEGPVGIPEKKIIPCIKPESPAFALINRLRVKERTMSVHTVKKILMTEQSKKRTMSEYIGKKRTTSVNAVKKRTTSESRDRFHKPTKLEPFVLTVTHEDFERRKQDNISRLLEEEKAAHPKFKAKPLPRILTGRKLPEREVISTTQPEPFKLITQKRLGDRSSKLGKLAAHEVEERKKATMFKAARSKVLKHAPFVPKLSEKVPTATVTPKFYTGKRAEERGQFDVVRRRRELEREQAKKLLEEERARKEEEEVVKLRKSSVHKAQPIKSYKSATVKSSGNHKTRNM